MTDPTDLQRRAARVVELLDRCQLYGPADQLRDEARQLLAALGRGDAMTERDTDLQRRARKIVHFCACHDGAGDDTWACEDCIVAGLKALQADLLAALAARETPHDVPVGGCGCDFCKGARALELVKARKTPDPSALEQIAAWFTEYRAALRTLAGSFRTVAERKHAIAIRDEFEAGIEGHIGTLLDAIAALTQAKAAAEAQLSEERSKTKQWMEAAEARCAELENQLAQAKG